MKDLTKGSPSRLILSFAIPIFFANLLQLTYSLVDTRIVGSFLGEDALAAVGATSTLSNLIIGFLLGLANGFAIITAQRYGAKDIAGVKKYLCRLSDDGNGNFSAFNGGRTDFLKTDITVFKCTGGVVWDGALLYRSNCGGHACNVSL